MKLLKLNVVKKWPSVYTAILALPILIAPTGCKTIKTVDYPDPVTNTESKLMLQTDWLQDPHAIDFEKIPKIPVQHAVVSDVTPNGVNQRTYYIKTT